MRKNNFPISPDIVIKPEYTLVGDYRCFPKTITVVMGDKEENISGGKIESGSRFQIKSLIEHYCLSAK